MNWGRVAMAWTVAGTVAVTLGMAPPVLAGTCVPVTVKGRAGNPAAATTQAAVKLTQRAAAIGGKIKNSSTDCKKDPPGFVCVTSAVVCPKR